MLLGAFRKLTGAKAEVGGKSLLKLEVAWWYPPSAVSYRVYKGPKYPNTGQAGFLYEDS